MNKLLSLLYKRKESEILREIIKFLEILENRGDIYFSRNNSFKGKIKRQDGSEGFIKNNKPGSSDIIICYRGRYIGLEIKTQSGKQLEDQKKAEAAIKRAGGEYYIVRSVNDVFNILK